MAEIWTVSSAKGGVGKSLVSTGFGIQLNKLRKKVLLIDFDFSGPCLHLAFNLKPSQNHILDLVYKHQTLDQSSTQTLDRSLDSSLDLSLGHLLTDVIQKTEIPQLDIIVGSFVPFVVQQPSATELISNFCESLKKLNYDFIIFDLGAEFSQYSFELFKHSHKNVVVTSPDTSSVEKTYRFVEKVQSLSSKEWHLIVNQCRTENHKKLGEAISSASFKKYAFRFSKAESLSYDNAVWQSGSMQALKLPNVFTLMPYSEICTEFYKLCKTSIDPKELRAVS